ncbi:UDP-N-acetylmuramoyl-tripeptide--D-alanyl-D-alanine ligase [Candidatus Kaiserbacteria bacterium]|nr:UDP-N-acetylmuramoyl-tripeptide--D-alanyl-D-alanine ligase [Candidatus Kaiserbacteria bacterium]
MKKIFKALVVKILTLEAAILIKRHKPKVIAVTGSVGKTSTKDAIFAAIKNNVYSRKSEKSFNSELGVPLTVLGLPNVWNNPFKWFKNIFDGFFIALFSRSYPEVLVLETGIDRLGDMDRLTKWLTPSIVVLTRLPEVPVHVEYFKTPQAVIEEKMKLVQAMKPDGRLIYNHDDAIIKKQLSEVLQTRIGYGRYLETDFTARADEVVYRDDKPVAMQFKATHMENEVTIKIGGTVGTQHVYSCIAAIAVADELSIPITTAAQALNSLTTPPGRMRIISGIKSSVILDDTYNSSPIACEQALQALNEIKYTKRKIAVLGDMLELGKFSAAEHKRIGAIAAETADILLTVGVRARYFAEGALSAGMSDKNIYQYEEVGRAGKELQQLLANGDVVLVKASQGVRAERIVEEVMANPEQAGDLLVRQDVVWKSKQ